MYAESIQRRRNDTFRENYVFPLFLYHIILIRYKKKYNFVGWNKDMQIKMLDDLIDSMAMHYPVYTGY